MNAIGSTILGRRACLVATAAVAAVALALCVAGKASAVGQLAYGGCLSGDGSGGLCGVAAPAAVQEPRDSAVSPDSRTLYTVSSLGGVVGVFDREPAGQLRYAGCVSADGSGGLCADTPGDSLIGGTALAVSPDGKSVYVASTARNAVTVLSRASGGQLTYTGCVSEDGSAGLCGNVPGPFTDPADVALDPEGASVYVGVGKGVAVFGRAPLGGLVYAGCVSNDGSGGLCADVPGEPLTGARSLAVDRAGQSLYVAARTANTVSLFERAPGGQIVFAECASNDGSGGCGDLPGEPLRAPVSIALRQDDAALYVASQNSNTVSMFNTAGDSLLHVGCASNDGSGGLCEDVPGTPLAALTSVATSGDGESVYVGAANGGITVFDRAADDQLAYAGCVSNDGSGGLCQDPPGTPLTGLTSVAVSPDDNSVYASADVSRTVSHFFRKTAPDTRIDSGPAEGAVVADRQPAFAFSSDQPGARFECALDGGEFTACDASFSPGPLVDGPHRLSVRAVTGGDADRTPATRTFRVEASAGMAEAGSGGAPVLDASGPTVRIVRAPRRLLRTGRSTVLIRFAFVANEAGASFRCRIDRAPFAPCRSGQAFRVGPGRHRFEVLAADSLGNQGAPATRSVRVVKRKNPR